MVKVILNRVIECKLNLLSWVLSILCILLAIHSLECMLSRQGNMERDTKNFNLATKLGFIINVTYWISNIIN